MMDTPSIFLSAASGDLEQWRNLLHKAFERAGCKVFTQKQSFGAATGDALQLLRQHLDKSDYVVHLAGLAYGSEPEQPPFPNASGFKCSHTQFEYYYAHQQDKKVISFVCAADFPYLPFTEQDATNDADRERRRQLQLAHRDRVSQGWFTGTPLEGRPARPLSEPIPDAGALLTAVAAAVAAIRDHPPAYAPVFDAAFAELTALARLSVAELKAIAADTQYLRAGMDTANEKLDRILDQKPQAALTALHGIPDPPRHFVGRIKDIENLLPLANGGGTIITGFKGIASLKGMGGIGKTALARVLAAHWRDQFPDAQIHLDGLGTSATPPSAEDLLRQAILAFHPDARLPETTEELRPVYLSVLGSKRVLLLLDNAAGAEQAAPLLPPRGCCIIVTSRHRILLDGVVQYPVGVLSTEESITLLRELCSAITEAEARDLAALCAGLPLALRLAGSRLAADAADRGGLPDTAGYLTQLRSGRLKTLDADAPDAGEVTISETLRLSEAALPRKLRETWRKLGVFPASFDSAAAAAIAGASAEMLQKLLRRSLIDADGRRHHLHDLAAEYACAQLSSDALSALRLSHAQHYCKVLGKCDSLYLAGAAGVLSGLALFDDERAQIYGAHDWLVVARKPDPLHRKRDALLIAYPSASNHVLRLRQHPRDCIAWLEAAHAAARRLGDRKAEGGNLGNLGVAWKNLGDARKAIGYHEQFLVIAREIRDRREEGAALGNLGLAWAALGDARKAIGYYEEARVIAREVGNRDGEGAAFASLGSAWFALGDAHKALGYYAQALGIARALGHRGEEGGLLSNLGNVWAALGDGRKASRFFEQCLVIAREIGDQRGEANALLNSASQLAMLIDVPEAIRRAQRAAEIFATIESPHAEKAHQLVTKLRGDR